MSETKALLFGLMVSACFGVHSGAQAAYLWWFILSESCDSAAQTCEVKLAWNSSKSDNYDKWRVCWKEKKLAHFLGDACEHNSKTRPIDQPNVWIRGLAMDDRIKYRVRLEGRRENGNWHHAGTFPTKCIEVYQNRYNDDLWGVRFC